MLEWCVTFFSSTVKTPVGVRCPGFPELMVERPMRTPFRNTYKRWSGILTITTTGPAGETSGFHKWFLYANAYSCPNTAKRASHGGAAVCYPAVCFGKGIRTAAHEVCVCSRRDAGHELAQ